MEPTQPFNPTEAVDATCLKAVGIFVKQMGFEVEIAQPQDWGYFPTPQVERLTWLRVAGEPYSQEGRINLFQLIGGMKADLAGEGKHLWLGRLGREVTAARAKAGFSPMTDWPAILDIYAKIMAAFRLMVQPESGGVK